MLTGRWAVIIAMLVGAIVAPALKSLDQAYQFIQEYAGFFSPGVLAIFLLGMFWKKTTAAAGTGGCIADSAHFNRIKIFALVDQWRFSGLSVLGPDDHYFFCHRYYHGGDQFDKA